MKRATIGAILLLFLGVLGVVGWYFARPLLFEWGQRRTSDAAGTDITLRIGGDNYLGYWFITSPELRKQAARKGIGIEFSDDGGAYHNRLQKFQAGEYDLIVLPVNSYLQHGAQVQFPGVIVTSISESSGADGIVAYGDRVPTGKIDDLNDAELRIVYTSQSPSEFLLDLTIADFDLDELQAGDRWRVETGGSTEVYKKAKANEGDVFVLWEPDLSRALTLPGVTYVWGSDRFSGYIVDVFVARREFLERHPEALRDFFGTYFRVLSIYANNKDRMVKEMRQATDLKEDAVLGMLDKIDWHDLEENRRFQFGLGRQPGEQVKEGLVDTIIACTDVMIRSGRLANDPLEGNPYLITNSTLVEELVSSASVAAVAAGGGEKVSFDALNDEGWEELREVGIFRVEPITFQSWDNRLTDDGKATVDRLAQLLDHNYPSYRIVVRGHTAPGGDETENIKLSLARSETVTQYMKAVHGLDPNRLRAEGLGSSSPPRRRPGESPRAYRYRLSRVEFVAMEANAL